MKRVLGLTLAVLMTGAMCYAKKARKSDGSNVKQLNYRTVDKAKLKMKIYYPPKFDPAAGKKLPAIVFFFGGGWKGGSIGHFARQSQYLASRGMIAVCAQYRTKKSHNVNPNICLEDARSAMRYVYSHAAKLGIDDTKILAGGGSAGGHLAAAVTFCEKFNAPGDDLKVPYKPKALVLFNPVIDNSSKGYGYSRVKAYWKDFSPMHNISKNPPPTLFMVGDSDNLIPVATAEKYKEIMEKNGGKCKLIIYKGCPHGFFNPGKKNSKFKETVAAMDEFLTGLGYLKPKK